MTKPNAGDKPRNIYDLRLNGNTHNFGGLEWIVDGEIGRMNYPGTWAECTVRAYYHRGLAYDKPAPNLHTFTINLDGKFYAIAMDLFATTIWAIGPDVQKGKENVITGIRNVAERDEAIKKVALPKNSWKEAFMTAREYGLYSGQLPIRQIRRRKES